jgi:hypothetical protein
MGRLKAGTKKLTQEQRKRIFNKLFRYSKETVWLEHTIVKLKKKLKEDDENT